jgi:hypothetical protein
MVEVIITGEMLLEARDKAAEMGQLRNSIIRGAGNIAGFLGEAIAQKVMGGTLANTYEYDLVMEDGTTVDVKTKQTSVKPLETYECSIAALNDTQECDFYAFVRVKNDFTVGWYLGVYNKHQYIKDSVFMKKGDKDPSNGYVVKSDCHNLAISQLKEDINAAKETT